LRWKKIQGTIFPEKQEEELTLGEKLLRNSVPVLSKEVLEEGLKEIALQGTGVIKADTQKGLTFVPSVDYKLLQRTT